MSGREGLLRVAEDRFLHGHLLSRWITDYVDLEESLAVGSIAQEEMAHAATLIEFGGLDLKQRDSFIFERPVQQWQPTALVTHRLETWPATVVRGYLLASVGVIGSLLLSGAHRREVRDAGEVMVAEQRLHVTHWQRWLSLLAGDARTRDELRGCADEVLPLARDVFGDPAFGRADGEQAHLAWVSSVAEALGAAGISTQALGDSPAARGRSVGDVAGILAEVRSLRVGADDGVRALYR